MCRALHNGRVCEVTSGCFVEAQQEKRWLTVGLLWSDPAGRFGSGVTRRAEEELSFDLTVTMLRVAGAACSPRHAHGFRQRQQ